MLKKTITYKDYNGTSRTEDFYFNLSQAEVTEMELSETGGLKATIDRVVKEEDGREIMRIFKELILKAYGKKSDDGRRFIKSPELANEFSQTEAYSQLFMKLATDAQTATNFVNGILPNIQQSNESPK